MSRFEDIENEKIRKIVQEEVEKKLKEERNNIKEKIEETKEEKQETMSRRDFLKKTGMGAAALGALGLTPASSRILLSDPDGVELAGNKMITDVDKISGRSLANTDAPSNGGDGNNGGGSGGGSSNITFSMESGTVLIDSDADNPTTVQLSGDYQFIMPTAMIKNWEHDIDSGNRQSREAIITNIDQNSSTFDIKATQFTYDIQVGDGDLKDEITIDWHCMGVSR